jgi:GWxTD domain-containing protein
MKKALLILLTLLVATPLLAAETKPLSRAERKQLTAKLSDSYRQFLADVEPIISGGERDTFLRLETDAQRDVFIEDFWRRRDIMEGTTNHGARDNYYARLSTCARSSRRMSDRGRIYLIHGVPRLVDIKCLQYFVPIQVWYYGQMNGIGREVHLLFYQRRNERVFCSGTRRSTESMRCGAMTSSPPAVFRRTSSRTAATRSSARLGYMRAYGERADEGVEPPPVNEEDVYRVLRSSVPIRRQRS